MDRMTRSILRNKAPGPVKRQAVKGYLVHRSGEQLSLPPAKDLPIASP